VVAERLHRDRVVDGALTEVRCGRIPRDELREQERDQRDPDREEDECDEPAREEAKERLGRPLARSPQPDRQSKWLTLNRQR
jgi:hypothetical protein